MGSDLSVLYWGLGRPSIAPEKLLRAMLLQAFYSIRSERQLMERLEFDLLFRWFFGLGIDDAVWDRATFSKIRLKPTRRASPRWSGSSAGRPWRSSF
jgi:transposase